MTDTPKKTREEVPPKLEEIVSSFERLSLTPTFIPPLAVLEQLIDTEHDLKDQKNKSNMAFRVEGRRGGGRRRGRPIANAEVLEAMQHMQARLEVVEMGNQGDAGVGDVSEPEPKATKEEEPTEVTPKMRFFKSVLGFTSKPRLEGSVYTGGLNPEELLDWINDMDKFFDYEEIE